MTSETTPATSTNKSKPLLGFRLWLARFAWLLIALAAVALFSAGLPAFRSEQVETYRSYLGFSIQKNTVGKTILIPDLGEQAAVAGMMERDVLEAIDERPLAPEAASFETLFAGEAGQPVRLSIRTGDRPPRDLTLIYGGDDGAALARLGLSLATLTAVTMGLEILVALGFLAVSGFIFWKRGHEFPAWLASLVIILIFVGMTSLPVIALYYQTLSWQYLLDGWFSLAMGGLLIFLFLFPSGRFVPRWTAAVMAAWLLWAILAWFIPELYFWRLEPLPFVASMFGILGIGIGAQVWRYRSVSDAQQKRQTKWVVWGIGVALLGGIALQMVISVLVEPSALVWDLFVGPATRLLQLLIPISFVLAIWRYQLWDIDLIINRTLVYGGLTAVIVALYILLVGGLGALLQAQGNLLIALLATGVVAVLFQPLRERLQRGVNRLMYGERDDPLKALTELGRRLEATAVPEAVLPAIVETITQTLRLPYAAITVEDDEQAVMVVSTGTAGEETIRYPLNYQSERVGELQVAPRAPGEAFSPADERILRNLARQASTAVYAVQLTQQLRRSRQRIITAREEERRRLRRDLHDGLGPQLASQSLGMEAVGKLMVSDPEKARELLRALQSQAQEAILDVRRLVYELRPPALDQLGLAGAIQESAHRYETDTLHFTFDLFDTGDLPAAVEVAAYRISQEAMTNVVRHAGATECSVSLNMKDETLMVQVEDNGRGIPSDRQAGVGLLSMQERAAELNGRCIIESKEGRGTLVRAELPF